MTKGRSGLMILMMLWMVMVCCGMAHGAETLDATDTADAGYPGAIRAGLMALGAAVCMAASAVACARVQAAIGAGGTATLAEKPDLAARIIVLIAIPETIVILGFVMAYQILGKI